MDMKDAICTAAGKTGARRRFDSRQVFGARSGKHTIFPVGLGSALAKAVREGFLVVVAEGSRRRGKTYEFTPEAAPFIEGCAQGAESVAAPHAPTRRVERARASAQTRQYSY
jgi:uridine phosphorylase